MEVMFSILIVIPTLNSYHLLTRLIESLDEQSFTKWRVLFIDGASSRDHKAWLDNLCSHDSRFQWEEEISQGNGIFAAMNQGFRHAVGDDWVLFWGSDDIAADRDIFRQVEKRLLGMEIKPDLYICRARYFFISHGLDGGFQMRMQRYSTFIPRQTFRDSLFWGFTPPHQATFFGPGARRLLDSYDEELRLTGDLDYFLRISQFAEVRVFVDELLLVLMGNSGVSTRENKRRIKEVIKSYKKSFGYLWLFPFVMRYCQRLRSLMVQT